MTMVFDPSAKFIQSKMLPLFPNYTEYLGRLEDELHFAMDIHNKTFVELLDSVAVRYATLPWIYLLMNFSNLHYDAK